jgi:hypothetical protein
MIVQMQVDKSAAIDADATKRCEVVVGDAVARFGERITRVEVHVADENGATKSGPGDKRCRLEARVSGQPSVSVSDHAATVEQAVNGAAVKLRHALESTFGRLQQH